MNLKDNQGFFFGLGSLSLIAGIAFLGASLTILPKVIGGLLIATAFYSAYKVYKLQ